MGTITRLNGSNLYWLGRYTERVFTTLDSFFNYFDLMIDVDKDSYVKYLEKIGAPNIYTDDNDFFDRYLFDKTDPNSLRSNLERAMDNGIVLREAIKSSSLSYLQLALNMFKSVRGTRKVRYDLLPVKDDLYAFWGSVEDNMEDLEGRDLIYIGKAVERLDLYVRLSYKDEDIRRVFDYMTVMVHPYENVYNPVLNVEAYKSLEKLLTRGKGIESCRGEALSLISRLVEVKTVNFEYSTEFEFSSPISAHSFTLRCLPLSDDRQIISEPRYIIQPTGGVIWNSRDSFGNSLLCGRIEKPHGKFSFSVKGTASITSSYTVSGKAPVMYAYQSPLTHPGEALTAFYSEHQPTESNVLYRALALADSLYEYMTYEKGATDVHTTAEEALTLGKGVCQDYAHIMLALCRMGGIPCRYVAGLACDEGETHAWVEVNDGSRWYGLDPVNNCLISTHYLKLCHGRDYADCPIESGCYVGITESTQTVRSCVAQ